VAIWQHNKRVLSIFPPRMRRNGYLWTSGQKSDPAIRFGDLDFLYDRCITSIKWRLLDIFDVFVLLRRMTLWPWPLTFLTWECFVYSASHVRPTYQLLLSYDYRLLCYEYWISYHISVIWNSHCACAVSRDLCIVHRRSPKTHITIFDPELPIHYTTFMRSSCAVSRDLWPGAKIVHIFEIPDPNLLIHFSLSRRYDED